MSNDLELEIIKSKRKAFKLNCHVDVKATGNFETIDGIKKEITPVYLFPKRNVDYAKFFNSVCPFKDGVLDYVEYLCTIAYPIERMARVRFHTGNEIYDIPHFQVMTYDVEQMFLDITLNELDDVEIEILPSLEEEKYNI